LHPVAALRGYDYRGRFVRAGCVALHTNTVTNRGGRVEVLDGRLVPSEYMDRTARTKSHRIGTLRHAMERVGAFAFRYTPDDTVLGGTVRCFGRGCDVLGVGRGQRHSRPSVVGERVRAGTEGQTKLVSYLEAVLDDVVFEMESAARGRKGWGVIMVYLTLDDMLTHKIPAPFRSSQSHLCRELRAA
jgi:hypothetical protein